MSYNVKVIDLIQEILKSEDSFSNRYDRMKYRIESEKPDLLGLQEATQAHMDKFLEDFGSEYGEVTYYREGGEQALTSITKLFDEAGPILYKKDKFELIEEGCFWLSDTPDVVGSNTFGAEHVRICTYARLKIIETGVEFMFYNTHLNWGSAQKKAILLIKEKMQLLDIPYFIAGDFNLLPTSSNYQILQSFLIDTRTSEKNMQASQTFNGFDASKPGSIIDFCFVDMENFELISHKVLNNDFELFGEGKFASDHFAIISVFLIVPKI